MPELRDRVSDDPVMEVAVEPGANPVQGDEVLQHLDVAVVVEDVPAFSRGGRIRQTVLDLSPDRFQRGRGERHEVPHRAACPDPLEFVQSVRVVEIERLDLVALAAVGVLQTPGLSHAQLALGGGSANPCGRPSRTGAA
ncbi:hypothetical protein [Kitasatospora sp. NPDC051914]|uniref:hypothetical protein n=1 Tax=Kitasatospora sp. NPDC051914 TaxID=3154945 RepID=UPI00341B8FAF